MDRLSSQYEYIFVTDTYEGNVREYTKTTLVNEYFGKKV